jgi:hypothetical protein
MLVSQLQKQLRDSHYWVVRGGLHHHASGREWRLMLQTNRAGGGTRGTAPQGPQLRPSLRC